VGNINTNRMNDNEEITLTERILTGIVTAILANFSMHCLSWVINYDVPQTVIIITVISAIAGFMMGADKLMKVLRVTQWL
jgi:hypothetical protein